MNNIKIVYLCLIISLFFLLFFSYNNTIIFAKEDNNNKKDKKNSMDLKIKINNKNIEFSNATNIKIIAYVNGDTKIEYLSFQDLNKKDGSFKFKFNKTNEISEIDLTDEYFVCGYIIDEKNRDNKILPYDCDEGSIISKDKNTARLFSTINKYQKSSNFYETNMNKDGQKIKIMVTIPIYDKKDIDLMNVIAMVRGEYQIKTLDIQDELKKKEAKKKKDFIIRVPFTFDRNTEMGKMQLGDMFFGCATADKLFPPEHTECEKRLIKNFDKYNEIVVRHEEDINR